ncbi:MAG: sigma-54 dependent transcriptional regulator [Tabrizicola sp.]|jgi:DNA-binding NtrC family response regulator|nr:sigma-54 dependent transcriptional regulator [Tabrizicola sp.]
MRSPIASRPPLLLIEDTISLQMVYRSILTSAGYRVSVAGSAVEGLSLFQSLKPAVVLLDLILPDRDGLELMQELLSLQPDTSVIAITANGSVNRAVEAMRAGAHDFLVKPFDENRFLSAVQNALAERSRQPEGPTPVVPPDRPGLTDASGFIGSSEAMARIHATIASVARSMATVFITGESGTGKELCALAVHANSNRANGPFIALNCGAIPQDLLESEVFGHMKGSFTGAISDKQGAATAADGGTLFLDEICEMAPALQTKLLRFLQTSTVQPVGATRPKKVNVRIVCATNRDPLDAVRRGQFREDLYYRLFVVPIHMPPLRDRGQDVIEIAEAALYRFSEEEGRQFHGLDPTVRALLLRHPWPGNVRQLLNVIRNVVVLNQGGWVTLDMLPPGLSDAPPPSLGPAKYPEQPEENPTDHSLVGLTLAEAERRLIEATVAHYGGSIPRAARVLDVSPSTLYRKIEGWKARAS